MVDGASDMRHGAGATRFVETRRERSARRAPIEVAPATLVLGVVALAAGGLYLLDPEGPTGYVRLVVNTGAFLAVALGPVLRGVRPRRVWFLVVLAGLLLAASNAEEFEPFASWHAGPFEYTDVMFLSGCLALLGWTALLTRLVNDRDRSALLDTGAACVGAVLTIWTTTLAQLATTDDLASGIVWAAYPPLDVALLGFAVHLGIALRRVPIPLRWLAAGFTLWLITDTIYAIQQVRLDEGYDVPALEVLYLVSHLCLARGMTHPRLAELCPPPESRVRSTTVGRRVAVILSTVLPALLSAAIPEVGTPDLIVRTVLLAVLLILLYVRITRTMDALARARSESHWRATHDPLTGLLNRAALFDAVTEALTRDATAGRSTVVLFVDCDDFKRVNDTWGHLAGDLLLLDLAERFPTVLRPEEKAARNGGDEFVVVSSASCPSEVEDLGRRVRSAFDAPLRVRPDRVHPMTPSIGIAAALPQEHCTTEELLGRADAATELGRRRIGRVARHARIEQPEAGELRDLVHGRKVTRNRPTGFDPNQACRIRLPCVRSGTTTRQRCAAKRGGTRPLQRRWQMAQTFGASAALRACSPASLTILLAERLTLSAACCASSAMSLPAVSIRSTVSICTRLATSAKAAMCWLASSVAAVANALIALA